MMGVFDSPSFFVVKNIVDLKINLEDGLIVCESFIVLKESWKIWSIIYRWILARLSRVSSLSDGHIT